MCNVEGEDGKVLGISSYKSSDSRNDTNFNPLEHQVWDWQINKGNPCFSEMFKHTFSKLYLWLSKLITMEEGLP